MNRKVYMTKRDWDKLDRLACPNLRASGYTWYALSKDPCPSCEGTGETGYRSCHNSKKPFHQPERLKIVKLLEEE